MHIGGILLKKSILYLLLVVLSICIAGCGKAGNDADVWAQAMYTEDTELGKGAKTVIVEVEAEDKIVVFTVRSDKEFLGDALLEHKLIDGEQGAYGLYVKKVNGIMADYDKNQCYWGFYKNGESMSTGVDSEKFKNGDEYRIVYTK